MIPKSPFILTVFYLALLIMVPAPAYAVEINDTGAKALKTMLSSHMDNYKKSMQASGGDVTLDGDITIEQGDGYYAATLPATTYQTVTGNNVKIGLIAINAIPTDNPNNWKFSMAFPTPILINNKNDGIIQRIDIGDQNMGGIWSANLESFSTINAQYNNVKLTNIEDNSLFSIAKISINSDLKENNKNLWSGPTNITLSNLSVGTANKPQEITIEEIKTIANIDGYKPGQETSDTLPNNNFKGDLTKHIFNRFQSLGNISTQFNIKNITINNAEKNKTPKAIDLIQFSYKSTMINENNVNQDINFGYNGLTFNNQTADTAIIPDNFQTTLSLKNFPLLAVINFAEEAIGGGKDSSEKQVAATKAMKFLPQKLKEAGTILHLKNTHLGNAAYNVSMNGNLKADPASTIGGIGELNIETRGLDTLIESLKNTKNGNSLATQLTLFRIVSEQQNDKNSARIELNETGNVTINGKDMSALLGLGGGSQ